MIIITNNTNINNNNNKIYIQETNTKNSFYNNIKILNIAFSLLIMKYMKTLPIEVYGDT